MRRRRFLTASGTAFVGSVLAGCTGGSGPDNGGGDGSTTTTTVPGGGTTGGGDGTTTGDGGTSDPQVSFDIVSLDVPEESVMGQKLTLKATVKNTGNRAGAFSSPIRVSGSGDGWHKATEIETKVIEPGKQVTWSTEYAYPYAGRANFRIPNAQQAFSIDVSPRTFSLGGTYVSPVDTALTVNDVTPTDAYSYNPPNGEARRVPAGDGRQWVFVAVVAGNRLESAQGTPSRSDIVLMVDPPGEEGTTEVGPAGIPKEGGRYESSEVESGGTNRGWIVYETSSESTIQAVRWQGTDGIGRWDARWSV